MRWRDRAGASKLCIGLVVGLMLWSSSIVQACTTPVYRYAMYNWAPSPFIVAYVHYGQPAEEDKELHQMIAELSETGPAMANLVLAPVDLSQGEFDHLPEVVQEAWLAYIRQEGRAAVPAHLVFTSWRGELFAGRLDAATLRAMVDSPARTKIGQLFQDGCGMVIVMLPGSDAKENERAEKVARELIDGVASGAIPVYSGLPEPDYYQEMPAPETSGDASADDDAPADEEAPAQSSGLQIGFMKVDRSDAAEKWFIASLIKMEPDLDELVDQPMIFFFYGRGRAMWPFVGKGITADNLAGETQFLAGPCSCMVKDQNPGVDQLMRWDWDSTADEMAKSDPAFYGGPFGYQEYSVDEAGKLEPSDVPETDGEVVSAVEVSQGEEDDIASPQASVVRRVEGGQATSEDETVKAARERSGGSPAVEKPLESAAAAAAERPGAAAAAADTPGPAPGGSFTRRLMWTLGLLLLMAAAVVLCAGFLITRKQAAAGRRPAP